VYRRILALRVRRIPEISSRARAGSIYLVGAETHPKSYRCCDAIKERAEEKHIAIFMREVEVRQREPRARPSNISGPKTMNEQSSEDDFDIDTYDKENSEE